MAASIPSPAPVGRPKDQAKRDAILSAARTIFFECGFQATSIESVAQAAGVARMTVYGHFKNKEALFAAMVANQAALLANRLSALSIRDEPGGPNSLRALQADLTDFGIDLLTFLSDPQTVSFNRLIEAEAKGHANLRELFRNAGPRPVIRQLTQRLQAAKHSGSLHINDPLAAAGQLIGLFRSIEVTRSMPEASHQSEGDGIREHVESCVKLFLYGYAAAER